MTNSVPPVEADGASALSALGYEQQLHRAVNLLGSIALTLSDITPSASVFGTAIPVILTAGTGTGAAFVIAGILAICVAACMGELGSMYPQAGGLFGICTRVLGKPVGFLAMLDYVVQAIFLPASVALIIGTYLTALNPALNTNWAAAVVMVICTALAVLQIRTNAILTGIFLAIELATVGSLAIAGLLHVHNGLGIFFNPVLMSPKGVATPVSLGIIFTAVATALFSYNGYDSAINWSEETEGSPANVGRSVMTSAFIGVLVESAVIFSAFLAASNLPAMLNSPTPLLVVANETLGSTGTTILIVGVIVAVFNATLAITLQFARIVWASGRDNAWPTPISRVLANVHPTLRSPWVATLVIGVLSTILTFYGTLYNVLTFTAVMIIVLYFLIALSALVSRIRDKDLVRPWRMWLWPAAPIVAMVGVGIAITQQKPSDLGITAAIFVAGLAYYGLYLRPRAATHWTPHGGGELKL